MLRTKFPSLITGPLSVSNPRAIRVLIQSRFLTASHILCKENQPASSDFNPRHLGVAADIYLAPPFRQLTKLLTSPKLLINVLIRKIYSFGLNTIQVALFRNQSGIKPNFVLWKNNAIECYVHVNTAFAQKKLDKFRSNISIWVQEALEARESQISSNIKLEWKLLKFNEVPRLVSVQSMMIPGKPLEHIQLVYRFNTKQRLAKLDKKTGETEKIDRDVIDNIVFLCDATTNEMILLGSIFESKPTTKLPKNYEDNNQLAISRMRTCGDIYRSPSP